MLVPEGTEGVVLKIHEPGRGHRTSDVITVEWGQKKWGITEMKPKELDMLE